MRLITLDSIVRENLAAKRLPIHYYFEMMIHAAAAVRELTADTLQVICTTELTLDAGYSAELPCGFVDEVIVGTKVGQMIRPMVERDSITPIVKYNITGQVEPYTDASSDDYVWANTGWLPLGLLFPGAYNDLGEATGTYYGANTSAGNPDGYKIFRDQNRIQFLENPNYLTNPPLMQWVGDGQTIDNASQIDARAFSTIAAYINWKRSPNAENWRSPEGNNYVNNRRLLRSRIMEVSPREIRKIMFGTYYLGPKNGN